MCQYSYSLEGHHLVAAQAHEARLRPSLVRRVAQAVRRGAAVHHLVLRLHLAVLALVVVAAVALLLVALALLVVLTHLVLAAVTLALLLQEAAVPALLRALRRLGQALVRAARLVQAQVAEAVVVHRQVL